jgi:hypothetical protein
MTATRMSTSALRRGAPLGDLADFARRMLRSRDVDPAYPVLGELELLDTERDALWRSLLYVAYYDLASTQRAIARYPHPDPAILDDDDVLRLPHGTERRGLRAVAEMRRHLASVLDELDELDRVGRYLGADDYANRDDVARVLGRIRGNGRWATFKATEILSVVHEWPLSARGADHAGSTGPRAGLSLFYAPLPPGNAPAAIAELDRVTVELLGRLHAEGVPLVVEELETLLCDFRAMSDGRYYVGHDIDLMLESALKAPDAVRGDLIAARRTGLPVAYLGEVQGWVGRSARLTRSYLELGRIGDRGCA